MKNLIRRILKEEKLSKQDVLKKHVLKNGWEEVAERIGGFDNLYKIGFNNDYNEFLKLFSDLEVVRNKQKPNWIIYRFDNGDNIIGYNNETKLVFINWDYIWSFFTNGIGFIDTDVEDILTQWLSDEYGLNGVSVRFLWTIYP
jgi:hypothetical protein